MTWTQEDERAWRELDKRRQANTLLSESAVMEQVRNHIGADGVRGVWPAIELVAAYCQRRGSYINTPSKDLASRLGVKVGVTIGDDWQALLLLLEMIPRITMWANIHSYVENMAKHHDKGLVGVAAKLLTMSQEARQEWRSRDVKMTIEVRREDAEGLLTLFHAEGLPAHRMGSGGGAVPIWIVAPRFQIQSVVDRMTQWTAPHGTVDQDTMVKIGMQIHQQLNNKSKETP